MTTITEQIESGISEIVLTADTAEAVEVPSWANVVLDLAGFTLSGDGTTSTIINNGILTIWDSVGGGEVTNNVASSAVVFNNFGGNLTIKSGIFDRTESESNNYYVIKNWGTICRITGGTFWNMLNSATIENGFYNGITDNPDEATAAMTITGGTFYNSGTANVIKNDEYGVMTITGGKFDSPRITCFNWNEMKITGGTFTNTANYPLVNSAYTTDGSAGNLTVTGGTFTGVSGTVNDLSSTYAPDKDHTISISGGTYNIAFSEDYLADGFKLSLLSDGTYGVIMSSNNGWTIKSWSTNGVGFTGLSSAIIYKETVTYATGGIDIGIGGFTPMALVNVTAEGGITGYWDGDNGLLILYQNGAEVADATELTNVQAIFLGH